MFKKINITILLLVLVLICQLYIIFLGLNPLSVLSAYNQRKEIETISKLAGMNPVDAKSYVEIGKTQGFTDLEAIRKESVINQDVYKDAKIGDKIIGFGTKMAIYRPSIKKLIYSGDTPGQMNEVKKNELIAEIVNQIKAAGHIPQSSTEVPQIAGITDPSKLAKNDFYADAKQGDAIVSFGDSGVVVLYDLQKKEIKKVAKISLASVNEEEQLTPTKAMTKKVLPSPTVEPKETP
ncbi:MAG: hypothetical protein U0525_01395 [Patescibacteria group bacterium]